jgi:hypothetical protein
VSDVHEQIGRVLEKSEVPADDATAEEPMTSDPHPDRPRESERTSFSRMRTGWAGDDARVIAEMQALADKITRRRFAVAFAVIDRVHAHVRRQAFDEKTGAYLTYEDGTPQWEKDEWGAPVENWALLSDSDRSNLLHTIAVHEFEWGLAKADMWFEAMVAKGQWEEIFSRGYTALPGHVVSGKPTIEDRTHWAQRNAAQERYFALFESYLSRRADEIVRSMHGIQKVLMETRAW